MIPDRGVEDLLRELAPQVLGALIRRYGQFDTCEDATQEALLRAAMQWPTEGMPDNPRGWLVTVASHRLLDEVRSDQARRRREDAIVAGHPAIGTAGPARGRRSGHRPRRLTDPAVPVLPSGAVTRPARSR